MEQHTAERGAVIGGAFPTGCVSQSGMRVWLDALKSSGSGSASSAYIKGVAGGVGAPGGVAGAAITNTASQLAPSGSLMRVPASVHRCRQRGSDDPKGRTHAACIVSQRGDHSKLCDEHVRQPCRVTRFVLTSRPRLDV